MGINLPTFRANLLLPSSHLDLKIEAVDYPEIRQIATAVLTVTWCKDALCMVAALTISNLVYLKNFYYVVDSNPPPQKKS